jgi:hypothetical protein
VKCRGVSPNRAVSPKPGAVPVCCCTI